MTRAQSAGFAAPEELAPHHIDLKIAARNGFSVIAVLSLLWHLFDLGYMTKEENQMGYGSQEDATA